MADNYQVSMRCTNLRKQYTDKYLTSLSANDIGELLDVFTEIEGIIRSALKEAEAAEKKNKG